MLKALSVNALFRKAYRDLTHRRVRSLLTIGAIAIGVAGVVAIVSTAQNLTRAQLAAYANASQSDITFWVWDAPQKTERALAELPNVADAELRNNYFTRCKWNGVNRDVYLIGIENFSAQRINQIRLFERAPKLGEFVAEGTVRNLFPVADGDEISCRARDGGTRALTLVGFAASPNYPTATVLDFATVYANANDVQRLLGIGGANQALIKVNDYAPIRDTARAAEQLLRRRGIDHGAPDVRDLQNFLGKRELDALFVLLAVFSVVGIITSGFLVANTLAAMTAEQVGEIGTMKAIGATRGQVLVVYVIASALFGIGGTVVGIILGTLASWWLMAYIGAFLNLDPGYAISAEAIALGIAIGVGVTIIAGAVPAFAATGMRVKQALEAYGITSTYGQGRVDRAVQKIIALPPLAAMSIRNLARRKTRSLITGAVIATAVAASLAAQSTSASVDAAVDGLFETFRADAWVWFDQYVGSNFTASFRAADGVDAAEVWTMTDAWVGTDRVRVWGVPFDTKLYAPRLVEGRWLIAGDFDSVVISTDLVEKQNLRVGDMLAVEIAKERRTFQVAGIVIDNSIFLGSTVVGKIFVPEERVERMQDRQGWAYFFALGFDAHDPATVELRLGELAARFKKYQMGSGSAYREVKGAQEQSRLLSFALIAMSLLVGAMGALGVLNTLTLNVLERRREIGILRAIGASDAHIAQTFLTEGIALGLGGWLIGILLGYPLGLFFISLMQAVLFHIDFIYSPAMILLSFLFAMLIALVGSLAPAIGAARMRVGQVLRYE